MIKMVICVRKDLKIRRGKEIAQAAHASMKFIADKIRECPSADPFKNIRLSPAEQEWFEGLFTKICVKVNSEQELMTIKSNAEINGIQCCLIEDSGATEFHGVRTPTCIAIGPDEAEKIDKITGHLELY